MPSFLRSFFCIGLALVTNFLVFLTPTRAEETPSFAAQLASADRTAAGLHHLSAAQLAALDAQVARELTVARQGDVVAFSRSFLSRRTADQVAAAGLAALTPPERTALDAFVARAVAQRPAPVVATLAAKAKAADNVVETVTDKPRLQGEVTLTVGEGKDARRYRVRGLAKNLAVDVLKVNLRVSAADAFHVDTLDLYSAKQRGHYVNAAAA